MSDERIIALTILLYRTVFYKIYLQGDLDGLFSRKPVHDITGKVALVTGGNRGIGSGVAFARPDALPVGRFGTVEEVGQVVVMLARNAYITGQTINVDGGRYPT